MSAEPILFDCVVFDLDGTLVATDRFWVRAARAGARRAFQELGLERAMPSGAEWLSMVGLPLDEGFDLVFNDLAPEARRHLQARCVEAEEAALSAGGAALIPGAQEALTELVAAGVKLGIASNCGRGYLEHMTLELGLGRFIEHGRCLDSPGIRNKADMILDILTTVGTRSAVMVGDRRGDAEAAHANGIPHVHLAEGLAPTGEEIVCEAVISDLYELLPRLRGRATWIAGALEQLGLLGAPDVRSLAITGTPGVELERFAQDLARVATGLGRPARLGSPTGSPAGAPLEPGTLLVVAGPSSPDSLGGGTGQDRTLFLDAEGAGGGGAPGAQRADLVLEARNPLGPAV